MSSTLAETLLGIETYFGDDGMPPFTTFYFGWNPFRDWNLAITHLAHTLMCSTLAETLLGIETNYREAVNDLNKQRSTLAETLLGIETPRIQDLGLHR